MFNPNRLWFKSFCTLLAALTTYSLCGREYAWAQQGTQNAQARIIEAARRLSISPEQIADPEAFSARQKAEAAARRVEALKKMREITKADEQEARAGKARQEAEKLFNREPEKLRRELARGKVLKLSPAEMRSRLAKASPQFQVAASRAKKPKVAPDSKPAFSPKQMEKLNQRLPSPRVSPQRGALTPELRTFYAEVAGEGVQVEHIDGSWLTPEEVLAGILPPPVQLASLASDWSRALPLLGALPAPAAEDLAETPETRRTPRIVQLQQSLGASPVALYNYVHTRIAPELYFGSKKGAEATLDEESGNDFDQASLLIALLRAAGIPARYEYGTVALSKEQALSLTGAVDVRSAASVLSRVAPSAISPDGTTIQMERAWVRAHVPYGDYRGTGAGGTKVWVRLDPAMKRVTYQPAVKLKGLVHFDFNSYVSQLRPETPKEVYEAQLLAAAKAQNLCNSLEDALVKPRITEDAFSLLPAEHPAKVVQSLLLFTRPPQNMRYEIEISVDDATRSLEFVSLQNHSLSLQYPGATAADRDAISAAGGVVNVVPYRVSVTPTLLVDGQPVGQFASVNPGTPQALSVRVTIPHGGVALMTHHVVAGALYGLLVQGGTVPQSRVDALAAALTGKSGDALVDAQLQLALAWYERTNDVDSKRLYGLNGYGSTKDVLAALAGKKISAEFQAGIPVSLAPDNYVLDVRRDTLSPVALDGDDSMNVELTKLNGYHGSALEHKVWENVLASDGISTMKVLQASGSQGVQVLTLTSNTDPRRAQLAGYSASTLQDVDQALRANWTVIIPQRPVNHLRYQNVEGYILQNPADGTGSYMIGSLLNGGESDGSSSNGPGNGCPGCSTQQQSAGSQVEMSNGNMRESLADLVLPNIGLPIVWGRQYASRAAAVTEVGYGWMHSYGTFTRRHVDGSFIYFTEDWREVRFTLTSGNMYASSPGWHMTLRLNADGSQVIRMKNGIEHSFNASGQLTRIAEPSGNQINLVYENGLLARLLDSNSQPALVFEHSGNKISKVTDRANRTVTYSYSGDDLVSATDALNHSELYAYDGVHNLIRRTDKRGGVWLEFYDTLDRWVGYVDPDGYQASASYDFINRRSVYVDRTGASWTYEFNEAGNPTAKSDPLGNRIEMAWDTDFNKTSSTDGRGLKTEMAYDGRGNLLERVDPDGRSVRYTYETSFNRVSTVTETGLVPISYSYDSAGRLTSRNQGFGPTTYGYDARGQLQSITEPGSSVTRFGYDTQGNVLTVTDPTNRVTRLGYDTAGHLSSVTDASDHARTMQLDPMGRVLKMTDALGESTSFTYDAAGNRLTATDAKGGVSTFVYDGVGRVVESRDQLNNVQRTTYDAEGRVIAYFDPKGLKTAMRYDAAGRPVGTTKADGGSVDQGYCAELSSEPCVTVDELGHVSRVEFDEMGRVTQKVDPLGRVTTQTYDLRGTLEVVTGPNQPRTTYTHSNIGRLQSVATPSVSMTYEYDNRGNRISVSASGQNTTYTYDLANRLLTETNPIGKVTTYTYDAAGNRETKLDANGNLTTYAYDANRQLKTVTFADGTRYEYDYDVNGNKTLEKSPSHERQLSYDGANRLIGVVDVTFSKTLSYTYDANGNRASLAEGALRYRYAYDAANRLKQVTDGQGQNISFDYDAAGRRTAVIRPNGVRSSYAYDAASQVLNITHAKSGVVLAGFNYGYDTRGNRVSKSMQDGTLESYVYDASDRLIQVKYGENRTVEYALDLWGNRTGSSETIARPSGPSTLISTSGSFNAFNQLTRSTRSDQPMTQHAYDNNGNALTEISGANVTRYVWDLDNRLRQVQLPNGGGTSNLAYDANGMRIQKAGGAETTKYLLDGSPVFAELDIANATTTQYLTNPQVIDEILTFERGGATYYPVGDGLGSVVAITDGTGIPVRTASYDVYGARTTTGTGPELAPGFTGQEHDQSGLIHMDHREYDPVLGRWTRPDPTGMVDGPNLYQYVRANPVLLTDPWGLRSLLVYGWPGKLRAKTDSGRMMENWLLTPENSESWESSLKKLFLEFTGEKSIAEIDASPIWWGTQIAAIERSDVIYDTVVYFGHALLSDPYLAPVLTPRQYLIDAGKFSTLVKSRKQMPNRVGLFGCDTRVNGFEDALQELLPNSAVVGLDFAQWVFPTVEDRPPFKVKRICLSKDRFGGSCGWNR